MKTKVWQGDLWCLTPFRYLDHHFKEVEKFVVKFVSVNGLFLEQNTLRISKVWNPKVSKGLDFLASSLEVLGWNFKFRT